MGQNFLIERGVRDLSLRLLGPAKGRTVVEVGPGLGMLTEGLLDAGAYVHAIEYDATLFRHLSETLGVTHADALRLYHADAVTFDLNALKLPKDFAIVSNLPYAITSPWLCALLQSCDPLPAKLVLMLQADAARRLIAKEGTKAYGPLTILLAACYERQKTHAVSRSVFYPIPDVDSTLLVLKRKTEPRRIDAESYALMRSFFTQRRKQIGGLCRDQLSTYAGLQDWLERLGAVGLGPQSRPEQIPLALWLALSEFIKANG